MKVNIEKLIELNEIQSLITLRKQVIILNPEWEYDKNIKSDEIQYDASNWDLPPELLDLVNKLNQDKSTSIEEKIIQIYEKISRDYFYDDNLISYIKKTGDDKFELNDGYGRKVDEKWKTNRSKHNRRVCFELSRYLAEAISELDGKKQDFNTCIFWDENLTHYLVGIISDEYSLTLDLDDFNNIKDLTRIKAGLTINGIHIFEDKNGAFTNSLNRFNNGKKDSAYTNIKQQVIKKQQRSNNDDKNQEIPDDILFLQYAMEILSEDYQIDSQGIFEYMKEIVDIKLGPINREKVWKRIGKETEGEQNRLIRCLLIKINQKCYMIDVDSIKIFQFDKKDLKNDSCEFVSFEEGSNRNWRIDPYRG